MIVETVRQDEHPDRRDDSKPEPSLLGTPQAREPLPHQALTRSPMIPVGRNISTATRIANAITSCHAVSVQLTPRFSANPRRSPPRRAPLMFPIPPITAAVYALMPGM